MSESERGKSRTSRWTDLPMHRSVKILWIFWKWNNVFAFSPAERASQFAVWSTNCYLFCVELEFDYITELLSHVLLMAKNEKSGGKKSRSHLFVDTLNETFFLFAFSWIFMSNMQFRRKFIKDWIFGFVGTEFGFWRGCWTGNSILQNVKCRENIIIKLRLERIHRFTRA